MPFAVELYFDEPVNEAIAALQERLESLGPGLSLRGLGFQPHISLLTCGAVDEDVARRAIREVAQQASPFDLSLECAGAFPPDASTLFLAPAASPGLISVHRGIWARLSGAVRQPSPFYDPHRWVPHCTVAQGVPPAERARALAVIVAANLPLTGQVIAIGLSGTRPAVSRFRFPLTG